MWVGSVQNEDMSNCISFEHGQTSPAWPNDELHTKRYTLESMCQCLVLLFPVLLILVDCYNYFSIDFIIYRLNFIHFYHAVFSYYNNPWQLLIQFCNDFWMQLLGWSYRSVHIHYSFLYFIYYLIFLLSVQGSWIWSKMWVWWTFNTMKCATSHLEMSV